MSKSLLVVLATLSIFLSSRAFGTELKPATARAFQRYVELTEARMQAEISDPDRFLQCDSLPDSEKVAALSRLEKGDVIIQPMMTKENGAQIEIPGGLVHHWMAIGFIPGATADQALKLAQDYRLYPELYKPDVQDTKILSREGQHFRVYYRFYRHTIVSVVYSMQFDVNYVTPDASKNYSLARALRIAEVKNPGKTDELEYPVGNDHGYMWRLNLYTRCLERDGGVYIQVEFLALSRTVPAIFVWIVNPYMHSIPREYLTHYLETTRKALSPAVAARFTMYPSRF